MQAVAEDGKGRYVVTYPKAKQGAATARVVKEATSYGKLFCLMSKDQ